MNALLLVLAVLFGIIALILLAALFVKKDYSIKRYVVIQRPLQEVFDYIRFLRNQDHFSKWVMTDPQMEKHFRGVDGTVGFVYAWNGNQKAGEGEQEIKQIVNGERVDIEVRFVRPFKSTARTPFTTERLAQDQTRVTWGMEGRSNYPLNLMYFMMAGVLGKDLEESLQTLKNNVERIEERRLQ